MCGWSVMMGISAVKDFAAIGSRRLEVSTPYYICPRALRVARICLGAAFFVGSAKGEAEGFGVGTEAGYSDLTSCPNAHAKSVSLEKVIILQFVRLRCALPSVF